MGGRSEATGETLGSEVRSTTSHYDDDEQESGEGLPPIPEGEEGPPSPNATVSEADKPRQLSLTWQTKHQPKSRC